jgi:sec-independent protein translocase protein TatC
MLRKRHQKPNARRPELETDVRLAFIEHFHELRKRLAYIVVSILAFSALAYLVQQQIVNFLLRPSRGQQFIYTSPGGGINFLFTVCMYVGIAASVPVIIHQSLRFFAPLIKTKTKHVIIRYSVFSGVLALIGLCFGYFLGLPAALHFLGNQFTTKQIHALFTIQEYMSFLTIYLLGSILLFQLPVILLFINRIRPLPPRKLLGAERYIIIGAFIIAMIMAPTPNILNQLIIVLPIILMYNLSILLVWNVNHRGQLPKHIVELLEHDQQVQADRFRTPPVPFPTYSLENVRRSRRLVNAQFIASRQGRRVMDIRFVAGPTSGNLSYPRA